MRPSDHHPRSHPRAAWGILLQRFLGVQPSGVGFRSFAFLGLCLLGVASCGGETPVEEVELRPVRTERVTAGIVKPTRTLAGVVRAGVESRLSPRVGGTVTQVAVQVGEAVQQGQVLARLDATDYELQVQEAEAALAQGRATLRRAQSDYERVRALYENNNAAESELDAARAGAESARAQVEAARQRLEQARQRVGYTVLRAPTDGAIAAVRVEVNENVGAGQELFLLISGSQPEVEVAVPEGMIAQVQPGLEVTVNIDALPETTFQARVQEVGVASVGSATTFQVTAALENPSEQIRSGMAAEVTFVLPARDSSQHIVVPPLAVGEDRQGRFVFVLEPGSDGVGVVHRRSVRTGRLEGGVEILEGLSPGELVVTAGVRRLADGMQVRSPDTDAPETDDAARGEMGGDPG
ncbi:MAG: efflux RND transporter periplasmic adaptor subunit [Acidobacteriota bacterium]|nr:efflux RND transporter periplasmic adaptor subunit [Acidobacteriota bacterium]